MTTQQETYHNQVAELYIVFFGRAPDAEGMSHWVRALSHGAATMNDLADEFARSAEYREMYGDLSTITYGQAEASQAIHRFYKNALAREPDADGLAFWLNKLKQGHSFADIAVGKIETAFAGGDNSHPEDTAIVRNKVEIAKYVALELGTSATHVVARAFDGVTSDPASVRAMQDKLFAQADSEPKTLEGGSGRDVLIGGIGNDRFSGGPGADVFTGALGHDIFVFEAGDSGVTLATADVVTDFSLGKDHIQMNDLVSRHSRVDEFVWIEDFNDFEFFLQHSSFDSFTRAVADKFQTAAQDRENNQVQGIPRVYAVIDIFDSGNTWMVINRGDPTQFNAEDSLVILEGVDHRSELGISNFILNSDW